MAKLTAYEALEKERNDSYKYGICGREYQIGRRVWPVNERVIEQVWNWGSRSIWYTDIRYVSNAVESRRGIANDTREATRQLRDAQRSFLPTDN